MVTETQVLDSMRHIMDPDLGRDIVSLGFIKELKIDGGKVSFNLELTTPACPIKERFKTQCEQAVGAIPGVTSVEVTFTARPHARQAGPAVNTLDNVTAIVAVSSCKGGVGKSTVAALLARTLAHEGLHVGLLDADLYGPSFPTLFNIHKPDIAMIDNKITPVIVDGMKVMSFGFLLGDSPAVMRGPMVSGYVQQLLMQTDWGHLDYLIIDMPPGTGDIQLTITQSAKLDGTVIVTTPQALSLVDVAKGILMFETVEVPVLGVVENMSYFVCDQCDKKHYIFGSSAHTLKERFGLPTLAEIPVMPGISNTAAVKAEFVIEPMRELASNLHRAIGQRRIETASPMASAEPGHIVVQWPDGAESRIPNAKVRVSCACAQCVDEFTGEQILDPKTVSANIKVEDMRPLGHYAIAITWSDGHASGIYSWEHLRNVERGMRNAE